jgi:hypothetical protein
VTSQEVCNDCLENIHSNYSAVLSLLIMFLFDKHANTFYFSSDIFPFLVSESAGKIRYDAEDCEVT